MSIGMYVAWPQRLRTGFVRCQTVLFAKSYKTEEKIGLPQQQQRRLQVGQQLEDIV